ncbi:MAG: porin family protein [Bacteroidota bacterium]
MKRTFLLSILLLGFGYNLFAQGFFNREKIENLPNFDKKTWSWGYYLGMNFYDFHFDYELNRPDIQVDRNLGFNIGLIGNLRFNDYIDLRFEPGVIFASRNVNFPNFEERRDRFREVKSSYVHLPLLLKFSTKKISNIKPFVVGGASVAHNLSSNQDNPTDNRSGEFRMKDWATFLEVGFGIDIYLEYFKFTPSIRGVFAISDELVPDNDPNSPWTRNINSMQTRGVFLNFTFQ